ncbi:MAG: hypothetical protein JXR96_11675 [Deltaproteobacteria bacterium]|nr:hypothetical protein [Deltaproteobacteria bacterium]
MRALSLELGLVVELAHYPWPDFGLVFYLGALSQPVGGYKLDVDNAGNKVPVAVCLPFLLYFGIGAEFGG